MKVILPYPPTINHYYARSKRGMFIKSKGQLFRHHVMQIALLAKVKPTDKPISLTVEIYPPDKRKRDIDNINKPLLDALEHAKFFENDSQIVELISRKHPCDGNGRVEVEIKEVA